MLKTVRGAFCIFQCDDEQLVEPKRYIGPQDIIYAQPVSLKPVGHPIAAIPVKSTRQPPSGSPVGYGPPRPVPYPSGNSPSYGSLGGPLTYGNGGPSFAGRPSYSNGQPIRNNRPGPVYGLDSNRPPQVFESETAESYRPKQPIIGPSVTLPAVGVQQHVHHHFHHGEGADGVKASTSVDPGFIPIGGPLYAGANEAASLYGQSSVNSYGGNFENYEGPGGPLYKKQLNLKAPASSKYAAATDFGDCPYRPVGG